METDGEFGKLMLATTIRFNNERSPILWSIADAIQSSTQTIPRLMYLMQDLQEQTSLELLIEHFGTLWTCSQKAPASFPLYNFSVLALIICMRRSGLILCSNSSEKALFDHCLLPHSSGALVLTEVASLKHDCPDSYHIRLSHQLTAIMLSAVGARRGTLEEKLDQMFDAINQFDLETHGCVNDSVQAQLAVVVGMCMISLARSFWHSRPTQTVILLNNSDTSELQGILGIPSLNIRTASKVDAVCALARIERLVNDLLLVNREIDRSGPVQEEIIRIYNQLARLAIKWIRVSRGNDEGFSIDMNHAFPMMLPYTQSMLVLKGMLARAVAAVGMNRPDGLHFYNDLEDESMHAAMSIIHRMVAEMLRIGSWSGDTRCWEEAKMASVAALQLHKTSVDDKAFPNTIREDATFNSYVLPPSICALLMESERFHRHGALTDFVIIRTLNCLAQLLESYVLIPPSINPMFGTGPDLLAAARQISLLMRKLSRELMDETPSFTWLQKWIERVQCVYCPFPTHNALFDAMCYQYND